MRKILALRDACEAEGKAARRQDVPSYENPYHGVVQHEQFSAWRAGWHGGATPKFRGLDSVRKTALAAGHS